MQITPETKAAHLIKEASNCGSTNYDELSKSTGISRSKLSRIANGTGRLYAAELAMLAKAFGLPVADFFGLQHALTLTGAQSAATQKLGKAMRSAIRQTVDSFGDRLSSDEVEAWYFATGGKLVEMPNIASHLTLFSVPRSDAAAPEVMRVGPLSLTADRVGTDPKDVMKYVNYLAERGDTTLMSYHETAERNSLQTFHRKVKFPHAEPEPFVLLYKTVLMPVDEGGSRLIWNYSKAISARPATAEELADPSLPEGD